MPYPYGVIFSYGCNPGPCQGNLFIEYGPPGFTPGTGTAPGPLGTVFQVPSSQMYDTITGLPVGAMYHYYIRQQCGTNWSGNSVMKSFSVPPDCNSAPVISCNILYNVPADSGTGAFVTYCSPSYQVSFGREKIFRFTASFSGLHQLIMSEDSTTGNPVSFYYKADSTGCYTHQGWNCIGYGWFGNSTLLSFGPLSAGVTYLIRSDSYYDNKKSASTDFKIECPQCSNNGSAAVTAISPYSAKISWSGFNNGIGEIIPDNNIPGSGSSPGINGNIGYGDSLNPAIINGLSPLTTYDAYARQACGFPGGINLNAGSYIPPQCPFYNYSGLGTNYSLYANGQGFDFSNDGSGGCFYPFGEGVERIIKFDPPVSGYYDIYYFRDSFSELGFKVHNNDCHPNTFSCASPYYYNSASTYSESKYLMYLDKDTTYDYFIDVGDTTSFNWIGASIKIQCPVPDSLKVNYLSTTSVEAEWISYCDSVVLEYGPEGFIPGTGFTAGGGTAIILAGVNSYIISGLTANTKYDYYIRSICGGTCSPNSARKRILLNSNCIQAPVVSCGGNIGTFWYTTINGSWSNYSCLPQNTYTGWEKFFQFTAQDSGMYYLYVRQAGWYCWNTGLFYREATTGCDEDGWICIGNNSCPPELFSFGPLEAGKTYYLMFDSPYGSSGGVTKGLSLYCPAPCLPAYSFGINQVTDTSAVFNATFMDTPGVIYVEYGPPGFIPGTDSLPGSGTLVSGVTIPDTLFNLTPATTYDVYIRQQCQSGNAYSENKKTTFSTLATNCAQGPAYLHSYYGDTICAGTTIYLYAQGLFGSMQYGAPQVLWYTDSCFSSMPFDTTAGVVGISPIVTTTYSAIAWDSCGFTSCVSKTIYVKPTPSVTITAPVLTFCPGDSIFADAGPGFNDYLWSNGDSTQSITITQAGNYSVVVSNIDGCTAGASITTTFLPQPQPNITGDSSLCPGEISILDAGPGFNTYLWSTGATTQSIQVNAQGTYIVTVTDSGSCDNTDSLVVIEYTTAPNVIIAAGPIAICQGDSVLLTASGGMSSYQWYRNNLVLPGLTSNSLYVSLPGNYKCIAVDNNTCNSVSNTLHVSIVCIPVGPVNEKFQPVPVDENLTVDIHPNPSTGDFIFTIQCGSNDRINIKVFDQQGRKVNANVNRIGDSQYLLQSLSTGLYFAEIECADQKLIRKLIQSP